MSGIETCYITDTKLNKLEYSEITDIVVMILNAKFEDDKLVIQ